MLLPNASKAIISMKKITDYVLSFEHFEGKNKARVFSSVLGLSKKNSEYLAGEIKNAVLTTDAVKQSVSEFGAKYTMDFDLTFENKTALVRTVWILENEDNFPRLITCYIKL